MLAWRSGLTLPLLIHHSHCCHSVSPDGAWCECGGRLGTLLRRCRSSRSRRWLILMPQPLMSYLFGNYRALGELCTIDKETQERVGGPWKFNNSSHRNAFLCILMCMCVSLMMFILTLAKNVKIVSAVGEISSGWIVHERQLVWCKRDSYCWSWAAVISNICQQSFP